MRRAPPREDDDQLHELLQSWKIVTPLPSGFKERVWHQIAARQNQGESVWRRFIAEILSRWQALLLKPAGAMAYVLTLLTFGLGVGYWQSETHASRSQSAWRNAYVQSVNPTAIRME